MSNYTNPKYSICVANLNMESTIEQALRSVLTQLDESFEVVVVDDGSSDNSLGILHKLQQEFANLKVIPLPRNRRRTLAETRNISIQNSIGEYVILHIDCDDYWYPYIKDFVSVYHEVEKIFGSEIFFCGKQINIGKKSFLEPYGPYRNGHLVEDRDLWIRMAKENRLIMIDHVPFRTRLKLTKRQELKKKFIRPIQIIKDEFRAGRTILEVSLGLLTNSDAQSLLYRTYKSLGIMPAWIASKFQSKIDLGYQHDEWIDLKERVWDKSGTIFDLFKKKGASVDATIFNSQTKWIFENSSKIHSIREMPEDLR